MSSITTITNPLMQPVQYLGQTYFTAQYFHQMYRNNSDTGGKYKLLHQFTRLIRSLETYESYVSDKDIAELNWLEVKDAGKPDLGLLFKSTSYKPIMLINATAQVALTHHLDDEVSKKVSVTANRSVANGQRALTALQQAKAAPVMLNAFIEAGKLLGTDEPMARAVGVEQVRSNLGVDFTPLLTHNSVEEAPVTPTALGKELEFSGQKMNQELERQGFQEHDEGGGWKPTEKGKPFCTVNPYQSRNSDHTGYQVLWYPKVLKELRALKEVQS